MARNSNSGVIWQVIAPWVRWPLASPRRLAVVLLGIVAMLLTISTVNSRRANSEGAPAAPSSASVTAAATGDTTSDALGSAPSATSLATTAPSTSTPTSGSAAPVVPVTPPDTASPATDTAQGIAMQFVRLWARPDVAQPAWGQALAPLATTGYATELGTVLPSNVPAHRVTAVVAQSSSTAAGSGVTASVTVGTDAGTVKVMVTQEPGQIWRVQSIAPDQLTPNSTGAGSSVAPSYTPLPTP